MKINFKFTALLLLCGMFTMISCENEEIVNKAEEDLYTVRGTLVTPTLNPGSLFIAGQEDSKINFNIAVTGESVNAVDVFKQLNGGEKVLHATVTDFSAPLNVTLAEAADGLGLAAADLEAGDVINITFESEPGGTRIISSNRINSLVACTPSVVATTYDAVSKGTSTDGCCPGEFTAMSTVTITYIEGIQFEISDWSGGLYTEWYEVYGITEANKTDGTLSTNMTELCGELSASFTEPFGESASLSGEFDEETGIIMLDFENAYGDVGSVVLTPQ